MAGIDYNEILLEAINAIVVSRISEVNFDRTIVATIVDASKAKDGEYVLSDGSVQFTGHSSSDKYKENDRVNVLIPSNDFSSTEKTILGKTSANANGIPITYVSPLEKIVPMETNYATNLKGGIIANSETEISQLTNAEWIKVNESTLGYDTLCVSARFKTLLNDYDIRKGHYGLLVQLKTKNGYIHALTLDSAKDMFGNPYGYSMYLTQEQTYHLNLQDDIVGIKIDLYQIKDFKYNDGINFELQVLPVMPYNNILVDNINVSFGYNAEQVEDNTVKINTADSLTYDNIKDVSVTKKLTLTWYNKDENNKYLGFSDGTFADLSAAQTAGSQKYYIKWEHGLNNGQWEELQETGQEQELAVNLNMTWALNEYRAIVVFDGATYTSNIIQFKNATGIDNPQEELQMSLTLHNVEDSSYDSYPLYGPDGVIINPLDSSKNREVYFSYASDVGGSLEPDVLNGATAYFYIPQNSTMLEAPGGETNWDDDQDSEYSKSGYTVYVKRFIDEFTQHEDKGLNLLKNTAPKELAGKGVDYNYKKQINSWQPDLDAKKVFARSSGGGKKTIMLKETSSNQALRAIQEVNLDLSKTYVISTQAYVNGSNEGASITVGLKFVYEDDTSIAIELVSQDGVQTSWTELKSSFSLQDNKFADVQFDKVKQTYIYLTTTHNNYTLFWQTYLKEKTINMVEEWTPAEKEYSEVAAEAKTFLYRIKKNYNPLFTNNSIILKIVDKNGFMYETSKTFAFSSHGTSGTDYSIVISGKNGENGWVDSNNFTPKAQLYDANYKEITDIVWTWSKYPTGTAINADESLSSETTLYPAIKAQTTVSWVGKNIQISGIYPISYSANEDYMYQGPTTIIYNSNGIKPSYYDGDLGIFKKSDNSEVVCTWSIDYYKFDSIAKTLSVISGEKWESWGELTTQTNKAPRFKPSPMYLGEECQMVLVAKSDSKILWRQPLIILQNQYASGLLNNWDGNLIVDNENNYILSSMMGAGSKDSQNRFSGVLMGEVSKIADNAAETGLFGYREGAQSFGFRTDGTAFIGRSGAGRIQFDGDKGIISSSSWINSDGSIKDTLDSGSTGLKINLKDGHLSLNAQNDNHFYFNDTGLDIKVNKLQLTSSLGGANLLKMTAPTPEQLNSEQQYFNTYWTWAENTAVSSVEYNEDYMIVNSGNGSEYLQQQVFVEPNKYYTVSGYFINVSQAGNNYLSVQLSLDEGVTFTDLFATGQLAAGSKKYFSKTFQIGDITTIILKFISASARSFGLYHAQLEEGTVATAWKSADKDTKVSITITENSITQYVGKSTMKYDTSKMITKPTLYGEGEPDYAANEYINQVYLDTTTGYYYTSDGSDWTKSSSALNTIEDELNSKIEQTADQIHLKVQGFIPDYYGTATNADNASKYYKTVVLSNLPNDFTYQKDLFVNGKILSVTFSYANTYKYNNSSLYLNMSESNNDYGTDGYGYPIYFKNQPTSATNPLLIEAGSTIAFKYVAAEPAHWEVLDATGFNSLAVNTNGITGNSFIRGDSGFRFSLVNNAFQVGPVSNNTFNPVLTVNKNGLTVNGHIIATSIDLSQSSNKINAKYTDGFADVAISGSYNDLSNQPSVPKYVADLEDGGAVITTSKVTVQTSTDDKGVTTTTSTIGDVTYTTYTAGADDYVLTDVGIGTPLGDHSSQFVKLSKEGLLTADNAIIYGELHATSGAIGGWGLKNGTLISAYKRNNSYYGIGLDANKTAFDNNYKVFAIGQLSPENSNDYMTSWDTAAFSIKADGSLYASQADITGKITADYGSIGGISISPNGISSNGVSGGIVFEKRIQHTVSAGTNTNTIKISGWNNAAKWYNFYYKITSIDSDIVFSEMNIGTEYYIISSLPTGNADNISYTYKKIPGTSSHTIPKSSLSLNKYLLVNTPVLLNIVSSFKLGSDGILEATGVKLLGEIIANSGSIGGFTLTKYDFPAVSPYPAGTYDALMCKYYSYDDSATGDNVTYTTYLTPRGVYTHYLEDISSSSGYWQFKSWYKIISS